MTTPAAMNMCPITSGRVRLNASDQTPVGMSDSSKVTETTVPRTTSWNAESSASRTKYKLETST
jgi:hypothetical protein